MIKSIILYQKILGFMGLILAIKAKITGTHVEFKVSRKDCKHPIHLRLPSSDIGTYKQIFLSQEYKFETNSPPSLIIDAGANIGLTSIYFTNKYPNAKIIAIEPENENFKILQKNTCGYSNIQTIHAALWHQNGEIELFDPGLGNWGFMTSANKKSNTQEGVIRHKIRAITINKLISDQNIEKVDILKIDIEGAEKEVFSDTSAWINKVDSMIVELHERMKPGCTQSFQEGTKEFEYRWQQGENVFLSKRNTLIKAAN